MGEKIKGGVTGKGFTKGDKRINRKGRPKSFDALRKLAQGISHENVTNAKGETVTVVEAVLRQWAASKDPRLQMQFVEVAYGKAPQDEIRHNIDYSKLSDAQLERIAKGEDVLKVILDGYQSSKSGGRVGAATASADGDADHGD